MTSRLVFYSLLILVLKFFFSCSKNPISNNANESQIVIVHAYHQTYYFDEIEQITVNEPSAHIVGSCFSNPISEFHYVKVGNAISTKSYFDIFNPGLIRFGQLYDDGKGFRVINNINPLFIEVSTSIGKLSGVVAVPDSISFLTAIPNDSLKIGQSLRLEWDGEADFYALIGTYIWENSSGSYGSEQLHKFVQGNTYTYDGSIFTHKGQISYLSIIAMNGPFPNSGTKGNMVGDGNGYLFYELPRKYFENKIIIGEGLSRDNAVDKEPYSIDIKEIISRRISNK